MAPSRQLDDWDLADAAGERPPVTRTISAEAEARARALLAAREARLCEDLAAIERQERPRADAPPPQFGKRIGDHTSDALESRRNLAAVDTLRGQLAEVKRALGKLDQGNYGLCDVCGESIPEERLEAIPWAVECFTCRERRGTGPRR